GLVAPHPREWEAAYCSCRPDSKEAETMVSQRSRTLPPLPPEPPPAPPPPSTNTPGFMPGIAGIFGTGAVRGMARLLRFDARGYHGPRRGPTPHGIELRRATPQAQPRGDRAGSVNGDDVAG